MLSFHAPLSSAHLRTYTAIFHHPAAHNLEWRDVKSLLARIGDLVEEPNGTVRVTREGEVLVLHPPRTKDVAGIAELMALRHFLKRSERPPMPKSIEKQWLLVIDHHEAQIYRCDPDAGDENTLGERVQSGPSEDFVRKARHSLDFTQRQEVSDQKDFFIPVADALGDDGRVLILGTGTGRSSEMEQFVAWATTFRPAIAQRIAGTMTVNLDHWTEPQLQAEARQFFANGALSIAQ